MAILALPPANPNETAPARAALPADPTPGPVWGIDFLSQAVDGLARYPDGWDVEGLCWTPYECGPVTLTEICSDKEPEPAECVVPDCTRCTALPFEIQADTLDRTCLPGDREQYARDQVALNTPLAMAARAHALIRTNPNIVDVTGDNGPLSCCKGAGVLRANRVGRTALHIPEEEIDCATGCNLISYQGGRQIDGLGARAYAVPGYPNIGPDGTTPTDGSFWMYGTSPYIDYGLTPIESSSDFGKDGARQNTRFPWARRRGLIRIECTQVFAVNVTSCGACCK